MAHGDGMKLLRELRIDLDRAREAFEAEVVDRAGASGYSSRTVAEAAGISHQTVINICARHGWVSP